MLISIVIPVYNTKEYLTQCIKSVLEQSFSDYEVLLIDDGSTDGSDKICDNFTKKHKNIAVIHKENGGAASARNIGIKMAKGKYIHFIDSDDFLPTNDIYSKITSALSSNADIIFSRRIRYNEELTECTAVQPEYKRKGLFKGDVLCDIINENYELTLTCPVNKLFKTSFLTENNLLFTEEKGTNYNTAYSDHVELDLENIDLTAEIKDISLPNFNSMGASGQTRLI